MNKTIPIFLLLLLMSLFSFSQKKASSNSDSLNGIVLSEYNRKSNEREKLRVADSIQRVRLEKELSKLKTTDNLKKEKLQKQLDSISRKENLRLFEKKKQIDALRATAKSFPVMGFFKDTLFVIYNKLGSFSAHDRADAITFRISKLADNYKFDRALLKIIPVETTVDLVYGETIILSVSENDAIWNNTSKLALVNDYKTMISNAIAKYKAETSFRTILKEIGFAAIVLFILGIIIFCLVRLFRWSAQKIIEQQGNRIKGITIKNYVLFDSKRQVSTFLSINKAVKWILILLAIYIALPILFGFFPWTKDFADTLFGYIITPLKKIAHALWNYLPNLFTIIVVFIVFRYVLKGIHFLKEEIEKGNLNVSGFYPDWANPTYQIIKVVVYAFMAIVIFPYLPGSDSPVFQGVSVFLGVLFTFGSSGSLSNVVAGLVLTYMRLFKIGDRVKIGEVVGDIIEKSLLVTRIRTIKNEIISIPNSTVMSSHTINYSSDTVDKGLIMHTTVTIGYDVPWKEMHQALLNAADRTELLLKEPNPFVLQTSLDDFYVSYQINAYTKEANKQATIYSQLHANIQDCCNEAGIEILSPHYRAARDGNRTTIPENYLDKDYKEPSFRVKNTTDKD